MENFNLTPSNNHVPTASVIEDSAQVEVKLMELHPDLNILLFNEAITGGLEARNETTHASANTAAGIQQWLKTVEYLRTLLMNVQWIRHEQKNCPFITSPDRAISIVVMTGNLETGKHGIEEPTNQAEKGAIAEGFVKKNRQLELFNRQSFEAVKGNQQGTQVWILLYHYDKSLQEVRFELSFPTGFDKKKITQWGERLILGSIPNNPADFIIRKDEPNAPATVEVEPKTGTFE